MLQIELSSYSKKFLHKNKTSNFQLVQKLVAVIKKLATNPLPNGCKKLTGYPFYRIRLGKYRIVYRYDEVILYVTIIEKRDKVYQALLKISN
jgi:mRNA interferase RelE/StbE